jgi:hypothetical protein
VKITWTTHIVKLEEEEPKEKMSMEVVESITKNEESNIESMPHGEIISRASSNKKHVFNKAAGVVYQSKEDLANQYTVKGNLAMS